MEAPALMFVIGGQSLLQHMSAPKRGRTCQMSESRSGQNGVHKEKEVAHFVEVVDDKEGEPKRVWNDDFVRRSNGNGEVRFVREDVVDQATLPAEELDELFEEKSPQYSSKTDQVANNGSSRVWTEAQPSTPISGAASTPAPPHSPATTSIVHEPNPPPQTSGSDSTDKYTSRDDGRSKLQRARRSTPMKGRSIVVGKDLKGGVLSEKKDAATLLREIRNKYVSDGDTLQSGWRPPDRIVPMVRTVEIWMFLSRVLLAELRMRNEKDAVKLSRRRKENAERLKEGLLRLGPTFIKLGQLLSTRVDALPKEYTDGLLELQDKVPGFSGKEAVAIMEAEMKRPIEEVFDAFDMDPIAAASLGQVHLAMFNDECVAVKVQRKGLRDMFTVDLKNLQRLAQLLNRLDPKTDGTSRDWVAIYEESARLLYEEIDYVKEGKNADLFGENFKSVKWVKVPKVFWERTTERMLTMEYCPGVKISNVAELDRLGIDRELLARRSGESYLTQVLRHGFFHCDPHPGNISVDGADKGRIIYYDFGMMSTIDRQVKKGLVDLIFGVYEGDEREICDALELMGVLLPNVDRVSVEKVGSFFLKSFRSTLASDTRLTKEQQRTELANRLGVIAEDLISVGSDQPFQFPVSFTFVFRSFTTLEGIGKGLDPNYDLTRIAQPYLKELIDLKDGSALKSAAKSIQKKLGWRRKDISAVVTQPRSVDYVAGVIKRIETGDLKIRARVLESERAYQRMQLMQENIGFGLLSSTFLNGAILMSASAQRLAFMSKFLWLIAVASCLRLIVGLLKLRNFDKKLQRYQRSITTSS